MRILGIETSCDETGIAIYDKKLGLIFNKTFSQKLHSKYGGVVPELASRSHIRNIISIINLALKETNSNNNNINGISYTAGPGLFGSLIVGSTVACSLAYSWNIRSISINHLEGHLLSPFIENNNIKFPFIGLLISGGHTQLIYSNKLNKYKIIGTTVDDSIGEVFDKVALLLGLNYPGGSKLSNLANFGLPNKYKFPKPMIKDKNLNFSFSGLKTYISNLIKKNNYISFQTKSNIALEFENTIIDILISKSKLALEEKNVKNLVISGGVSSNIKLRNKFKLLENQSKIKIFLPKLDFCTDNGAMIAYAGFLNFKNNKININKKTDLKIFINSKWSIENL